MPFPLLNSEGVKFLSLNFLNSPEGIRGCYLKISYQHLKHFLSAAERIMILPHSHSPSVIEPSQAMSAAAREPRRSQKANGVKCMTF